MRPILLLLLTTFASLAADENLLALALRAQSDFDRVELSSTPSLPETLACVQSQAMVLPVTRPAEMSLIYYRKGYCEFMGATVAKDHAGYREAAHDFEKAIEAWPDRIKRGPDDPACIVGTAGAGRRGASAGGWQFRPTRPPRSGRSGGPSGMFGDGYARL